MDKATIEKAKVAYIRARISLLSSHPFYAHLVLKMPLQWMEQGEGGGLSCTDGETMFIQPDTYLALTPREQVSVLVHEVLHCAAGHLFRCGSRDKMKFNVAGDVYIANAIEADGLASVAGNEMFLKQYGINRESYRSMTTEQIYDKIPDPPKQRGGQSGSGSGSGCGHAHPNGPGGCYKAPVSGAASSKLESEWKQAVIEAGQMAGSSSGAWSELVAAAMPKPPFTLKLHEFLQRGVGGDTTFDHFNRRYVWQGMYLPCDTKEVMGRITWICDTSGSMGKEQLALAFGYARAFREQHPCVMDVIECDYNVANHKVFEEHEVLPSEFEARGRGGTSFDAPFKLLREKRIEPKVVIYVTDGYGSVEAESNPRCPVLWVVVADNEAFKPPFGECVYVK